MQILGRDPLQLLGVSGALELNVELPARHSAPPESVISAAKGGGALRAPNFLLLPPSSLPSPGLRPVFKTSPVTSDFPALSKDSQAAACAAPIARFAPLTVGNSLMPMRSSH